jgi:phosphoglycolate phosphatase-like HAD superfamily hydrolase
MSVAHEEDYRRRVAEVGPTRFLPGTSVEIVREVKLDAAPRFAVFDFDGTLSLVREGWPDVMIPMMVEELAATGTKESPAELAALARNFVMELNGKQTIYQMIRLAEEIRTRGGTSRDPLAYKQHYHDRLMERIASRRQSLEDGTIRPEELLVPGAYAALRLLQERGLELYLASGTDENYVREEAELLGLTPFFGRHIYGAIADHRKFSKQMVIERILRENQVEGARLIGLGDGYVEIDNIKGAGGTAIAVASDEAGRSGKPDPWKRDRLIGVGADLVIPDFREFQAVCDYLWRDFR